MPVAASQIGFLLVKLNESCLSGLTMSGLSRTASGLAKSHAIARVSVCKRYDMQSKAELSDNAEEES